MKFDEAQAIFKRKHPLLRYSKTDFFNFLNHGTFGILSLFCFPITFHSIYNPRAVILLHIKSVLNEIRQKMNELSPFSIGHPFVFQRKYEGKMYLTHYKTQ